MLSRSAERIYWAGRYLERAENSARIIQQYSHLLLDLPSEVGVDWSDLVRVVGAAEAYAGSGKDDSADEILQFLLVEPDSFSSLAFSIRMARENIRNTRDLLPHESWENVNEFYQFARENLVSAADGRNRFDVLAECIGRCQQINGTLIGTMSHHSPYHFLTLGQCIERADMTSRIIDVAAAYIQQNERLVRRYGSTLWTNVLKSVSGFQMYRQYRQPQVVGAQVIDFLLRDSQFPRAIRFCLVNAAESAQALPRGDDTVRSLSNAEAVLDAALPPSPTAEEVSKQMDQLQKRLADTHNAVVDTWFLPEHS